MVLTPRIRGKSEEKWRRDGGEARKNNFFKGQGKEDDDEHVRVHSGSLPLFPSCFLLLLVLIALRRERESYYRTVKTGNVRIS